MLAAVLIVTAIVCSGALGNGFPFDDEALIVHNVALGDWSFPLKALTHQEFFFSTAGYLSARPKLSAAAAHLVLA